MKIIFGKDLNDSGKKHGFGAGKTRGGGQVRNGF